MGLVRRVMVWNTEMKSFCDDDNDDSNDGDKYDAAVIINIIFFHLFIVYINCFLLINQSNN